ncbi:MAG: hypothetical protein A3F74_14885 [Betaproteobacteria bacterium RIFCSPLOWO2_12_FULL_62_58]|nr:MAG: hypothetical protein A3I62_00495 [Betaproteobacteria bacterium RIFCSPLOWO2_02_FULL_62_79]OGA44382.1 MAG: hypothetical protein A3F74_14885 [Betaproteobacteria bacterium RIFCSPLOWO2_12_FULL_62_58]
MKKISDFTDADRWVVETALKERYGRPIAVEIADSEIKLDQASAEITLCPTFYWEERGVEFVVFKVAADRYRSQFYYSIAEQYGTGRDFHDLAECVTTTLRLQADHEKDRAGATSGKTGADLSKT